MPLKRVSRRAVLAGLTAGPLASCNRRIQHTTPPLVVFAAASLGEVIEAISADFSGQTHQPVRTVHAGSAQLARQIDQGAPADVFISADEDWMDWLQVHEHVVPAASRIIASNALVLIAPQTDTAPSLDLTPGPALRAEILARLGDGRLALAEPDIPAGHYARQALTALGLWDGISDKLAGTENVRAALALVARGECPLGIVYATDAIAESRVRVVGAFAARDHAAIVYPAAAVQRPGADPERAQAFVDWLAGPKGQAQLHRFGFAPPP